ncbi:recombinase family protein [Streptomyces sp. NPDC058579]|uniref:recombinase family protein n=1 Tax=Streptomyces sp. NPDC058579 TaxID=3346548 RepID=UPI00366618A7
MPDLPYIDLYLRKSRVVRHEDPRDLTSIQAQEDSGRTWATREGYRVRHVWVDNLSAWSDIERPEFDKALAAVLAGEVPALWCAYLDRFSRKGIDDIGPILGKARVIFDYDGLDSSVERDRRWIIDRAEQAREYSMRLSYNVKTTKAAKRARGQWTQAAPYGLRADASRKLHHIPGEWRIVRHIVESVALGFAERMVAKALNSGPAPITGPGGGTWQANAISRILHNPVYEGWQVAPRRGNPKGRFQPYRDNEGNLVSVFAAGVEPIPPDLMARARQVAAGQAFATPEQAGRIGTVKQLLTDSVKCRGCHGGASPDSKNYRCWRAIQGVPCDAPVSVTRSILETYVTEAWFTKLNTAQPDDPILQIAAERWAGLQQEPADAERMAKAVSALKAAEAGVERLAKQQADGFFDPPFDTHLPRLQVEARAALAKAKKEVAEATPKKLDVSFLMEDATIRAAWEEAALPHRRDLLRLALRRVVVTKGRRGYNIFDSDERVEIHWLDSPDPWASALTPEDLEQAA